MAAIGARVLHIQVQLHRQPGLDEPRVVDLLLGVGREGHVLRVRQSGGDDEGRWLGFSYTTGDVGRTWSLLRAKALGDADVGASLARAAIVVCQGDAGWDDYLLLHHFDPDEPLDRL
jgi:hypothetical protein